MIPEFTKKPIISQHSEQNREQQRLYSLKAKALDYWLQAQTVKEDEYFRKAILWWKINAMLTKVSWDDIIDNILTEKYLYLSTKFDVEEHLVVDLFIEKAVTKFQIEQKKLNPVLTFVNKHYLYLLLRFIDELPNKLEKEPDEIKKVNIELLALSYQKEITIFQHQERMAKNIKISREDADKIHANMIADYVRYIGLSVRKRNLLQAKLETYHYTDPIEKIDDELAILQLGWDIKAKKTYIDYFRERKV